ncbi:hypothetical protein HK100_008453, partial [Physocladia obscura]
MSASLNSNFETIATTSSSQQLFAIPQSLLKSKKATNHHLPSLKEQHHPLTASNFNLHIKVASSPDLNKRSIRGTLSSEAISEIIKNSIPTSAFLSLSSLNLSNQIISHQSANLLASYLTTTYLRNLSLKSTSLSASSLSILLPACTRVNILDISNNIDSRHDNDCAALDTAALAVSRFIACADSQCRVFDVSANAFTGAGVVAIARAIGRRSRALEEFLACDLDLSIAFPELCKEAVRRKSGTSGNSSGTLKKLMLRKGNLLPRIFRQGLEALFLSGSKEFAESLENLDLGLNSFPPEIGHVLATLFQSTLLKSLTHLNISGSFNPNSHFLGDDSCEKLLYSLTRYIPLFHLNISRQQLGNRICNILKKILAQTGLQEIILIENNISDEGVMELSELMNLKPGGEMGRRL